MKRSEINFLIQSAQQCFLLHGWSLPPAPRWDVTDFGLGNWRRFGLVLINLAEEPEYCEKLMYAQKGMTTPAHTHKRKKEDIISRWGTLRVFLWPAAPGEEGCHDTLEVSVDGAQVSVTGGGFIDIPAGSRITLVPGVYHEFMPVNGACIIGEVSTVNDDRNDNFFSNPEVGRFPGIDEDEPPLLRLLSDPQL